jgi:very-short-patch-repair endonuclease
LAFSAGLAESPFESVARVAFDEAGLPPPELQVWVGEERPIARVDFLWRKYRTIAEADGAIKYDDPDRARQQLQRDADLRDAGFEVVHFSWRELMVNAAQVIERIKAAFARAAMYRRAG